MESEQVSSNPAIPPAMQGGAPNDPGMSRLVQRNIRAMMRVRQRHDQRRAVSDRFSDVVSSFAGSIWSVLFHAAYFGGWLLLNSGFVNIVPHWDPYPFVMLAMLASVEAIFLSTFVLISQNRMQRLADQRAEMDLQISLLTEQELSRAIVILDGIAERVGSTKRPPHSELEDAERDLNPEKIAEQIEESDANP
jgi:uncharacterized membrane protein